MKCKKNQKYTIIITMMLALFMLMGCTLTKTEDSKGEVPTTVQVENVEEVETKVSEEAATEESVVEETVEALYIPEGIDMASTLPGEEWVASFVGNVAEPVVVIYNDNTGRKEVVQANSEVTINPDEDMIAVYFQDKGMGETTHAISVKETKAEDNYHILIMDSEKMRSIPERPAKVTVRGGAEDWVIEFTIIVE